MKTNQTTWIAAAAAAVGGVLLTTAYYGRQYGIGPFARVFYNPENFDAYCTYSTAQMEQMLAGEMASVQMSVAEGWMNMEQALEVMEDGAVRIMAQCRREGLVTANTGVFA